MTFPKCLEQSRASIHCPLIQPIYLPLSFFHLLVIPPTFFTLYKRRNLAVLLCCILFTFSCIMTTLNSKKMYIVYDKYQRPARVWFNGKPDTISIRNHLPDFEGTLQIDTIYSDIWYIRLLTVPEFKPIKLVRISDMKAVPGSTVSEHYWALSYSWNQSGTIIHMGNEDYERVDESIHQIVTYHFNDENAIPEPGLKSRFGNFKGA